MELNQFIWNNYKESKEGQEVIKLFKEGYLDDILSKFAVDKNKDLDYYLNVLIDIIDYAEIPNEIELKDLYLYILEEGLKGFDDEKEEKFDIFYPKEYEFIISVIEPLSLALFNLKEEEEIEEPIYIPYFFQLNFAKLQKIADTFNVELPKVPLRKDKRERALYYLEFCKFWNKFRKQNNLTIFELCAFLYDFAPKFIGKEKEEDLPEPTNIWITGGGVKNGDYKFLSEAKTDTTSFWSGNEDAVKGDIILMYCLSPKSSIEFVCRAITDGIRDPFFWYYGETYIGHIQHIKPITLAEIKTDEHLKGLPIVRKNFQGVNGTRLHNEDYTRILEILEQKGEDISRLPKLSSVNFIPNKDCKNEREVEVKIVEPFLKDLNYSENDWVRQLPVRMGRGERNFPDYVFFAETKKGYERGKMILETKFYIKSNSELEETFQQAQSYALRLNANRIVICDKDFIWIYMKKNNNFDRTKYLKYNWQEMNNPEIFNTVKKQIGKDFIR
ncbi:Uncharacterised protein [Capnocytophaga ochracea]|uniref:Type I restriction enzyme R protein N-terminal domain-containing protein n=1 Tax=Capnocytophaga ochracea TaxID=1018 RepID=A0A7Z9CCI4_CAPOC|nr:restriction endonuclease subunit R [Capnocytophaga ochracea]VDG83013.1 Uncharacterised protein [Capnocytophaga ochracea]